MTMTTRPTTIPPPPPPPPTLKMMLINYEGSSSLDCWEDYNDDVSCLTDYSGMPMSDIEGPGSNGE